MAVVASDMPFLASTVREHGMGEAVSGSRPATSPGRSDCSSLIPPSEHMQGKTTQSGGEFFSWEKQFETNYPWGK